MRLIKAYILYVAIFNQKNSVNEKQIKWVESPLTGISNG